MNETAAGLRGFVEAAKGLSRNPLGIFGLFLVLVYAIAALVALFATSFTPFQRNALTVFLVGFPLAILIVFAWLVSCHSGKLFAPSDYRDDATYLQAVQAAVVRVEKLSEPEPAQGQVHLTMASAEIKTLLPVELTGDEIGVTPNEGEPIKPKADWKRTHYQMAYLYTLRTGDPKNAEVISDAYLGTEQAGQDGNTASWKAFRLGALLRFTNESNLDNFDELKRLANPTLVSEKCRSISRAVICTMVTSKPPLRFYSRRHLTPQIQTKEQGCWVVLRFALLRPEILRKLSKLSKRLRTRVPATNRTTI